MRGVSSGVYRAIAILAATVMVVGAFAVARHALSSPPGSGSLSNPSPTPTYSGTGLPSLDPDDAKFFGVAGSGQMTLEGVQIVLYIGVPAGTSTFSIGLFDGDVGGSWDDGSASFSYKIYKDPRKNDTTAMPLDTITSAQATNDDWYDKTYSTDNDAKAPSGNYFYRMDAGWTFGTPTGGFNNFKVRTSGQISVRAGQDFGFAAGPQNTVPGGDPFVGSGDPHPGDQNDPNANSYDGQFTYYFYVPTTLPSITFWDGDNDRADDTDDPNTPNTDPDGSGPAVAEGVNLGAPPDDPPSPVACCTVPPSIYYDILDPQSHLYTNNNPSGNTEWERFVVGDTASDPDILVTYELQPGLWRYQVHGMDAHNLNVLRSTYEIYSNTDLPLTVNPAPSVFPDHTLHSSSGTTLYYSHTVKNEGGLDEFNLAASSSHGWATAIYADSNGNGVLDPGEPKITQTGPMAPGQTLPILLELVVPAGLSHLTDIATVTASSRTEWAVQGKATDTTILSSPPEAVIAPVGSVREGTPVTLDASGSSDPDEDPLQFRWDFNGDGTWDTGWSPNSNTTYTWGDDWTGIVRVEVTDGELNSTAETSVTVFNVSPNVTNITISPASPGCGGDDEHGDHDGDHEHDDEGCGDRDDDHGCHDDDHDRDAGIRDRGGDEGRDGDRDDEHDHEGCGCGNGDHDDEEHDHDGEHEHDDDDDHDGGSCGVTYVFNATAVDPGSDDLTFHWDFGDGTNASHTYYNNGVSPDPYPSPGPTFPVNVTNVTTHTYTTSGNFTVILNVTDDDGGIVTIVRHVLVCAGGGDDEHGDHDGDHEHDDDGGCGCNGDDKDDHDHGDDDGCGDRDDDDHDHDGGDGGCGGHEDRDHDAAPGEGDSFEVGTERAKDAGPVIPRSLHGGRLVVFRP